MKAEDDKFVFETSMQRALNRETMSKETLNAETFEEIENSKGNFIYRLNRYEFAEAYHKAKVNAITDEEIIKRSIKHAENYNKPFDYTAKSSYAKGQRDLIDILNGSKTDY